MGWQSSNPLSRFRSFDARPSLDSLFVNEQCFIRKEHKCGKIIGASKSCFIACPTSDDLEPILELMSEKLTKVGIEPVIAVKQRAYGQDIFCTKICGRIIESRFCVAILDDSMKDSMNIPNPNVYYEYGLMTALKKHIIPLQKEGLALAFNIQSYDTIKYNGKNIGPEFDRAIKEAVRITEAREHPDAEAALSEKALLHRMEIAGFRLRDDGWFLHEAIADTNVKGFGQYERGFYVFLAKIDDSTDAQECLDDLEIILYRTEKKAKRVNSELVTLKGKRKELKSEIAKFSDKATYGNSTMARAMSGKYEGDLKGVEAEIDELEGFISLMKIMYVGLITNPCLKDDDFRARAEAVIKKHERYRLTISNGKAIDFGDISVPLAIRKD